MCVVPWLSVLRVANVVSESRTAAMDSAIYSAIIKLFTRLSVVHSPEKGRVPRFGVHRQRVRLRRFTPSCRNEPTKTGKELCWKTALYPHIPNKKCSPVKRSILTPAVRTNPPCGKGGIRTPGTRRYNGFRDRHNRPLCHLSVSAGIIRRTNIDIFSIFSLRRSRNFGITLRKRKAVNAFTCPCLRPRRFRKRPAARCSRLPGTRRARSGIRPGTRAFCAAEAGKAQEKPP